jgi:hypothetical protein
MRCKGTILGAAVIGLLMASTLSALGLSGTAKAAQSVQPAPSISRASCQNFNLSRYDDLALGNIGANYDLYFTRNVVIAGYEFCQTPIAPGSRIVTIFGLGTDDCLALNATTAQIYLHNPNGCGTATDTQWRFIYLKTIAAGKVYAIQNQYAPSGKPCMYDNIEANPATIGACSSDGTDSFLWFVYRPS